MLWSTRSRVSRNGISVHAVRLIGMALTLSASVTSGCGSRDAAVPERSALPSDIARSEQQLFLSAKHSDPWTLTKTDPAEPVQAYVGDGKVGTLLGASGEVTAEFRANDFVGGQLQGHTNATGPVPNPIGYSQSLDFQTGQLTTVVNGKTSVYSAASRSSVDWKRIWSASDIVIDGDVMSQQITHAFLYYTLASIDPSKAYSAAPFGLSSNLYGGHVFWDADTWMLPALLPQFPAFAKSIVQYRVNHLTNVETSINGIDECNYPWESADTGNELAPAEFANERHINSDVALAAWQYYLWTGDSAYLKGSLWPILRDTANYWARRAERGADGRFHINKVLTPDETAGLVNDDAYTNAAAAKNLEIADTAARLVGQPANSMWAVVASHMYFARNQALAIPSEHAGANDTRMMAKQADLVLLVFPLRVKMASDEEKRLIAYARKHTIASGPAMTASMNAIAEARLGDVDSAYADYLGSWQPFIRGSFAALAEKANSSRTHFVTGMCGTLQTELYGFAGLSADYGDAPKGAVVIAKDRGVTLSSFPHLPRQWKKLELIGICFHGKRYNLTVTHDHAPAVVRS